MVFFRENIDLRFVLGAAFVLVGSGIIVTRTPELPSNEETSQVEVLPLAKLDRAPALLQVKARLVDYENSPIPHSHYQT